MANINFSFSFFKKPFLLGFAVLIILAVISLSFANKAKKQPRVNEQFPLNFPEFSVYPKAMLKSSSKNGVKYKTVWEIDKPVPKVMSWYIDILKNSDWKIDVYPADPNAGEIQFLVAKKQDLTLNLSVIREDNTAFTSIIAEFPPPPTEDKE